MKTLTILVPAFNEAENLPLLRQRLDAVLDDLKDRVRPEIILLDNCSTDGTAEVGARFCAENPNWKYVRYARNFGYHGSLACGFDLASGDALIVLAGDLQEPPELIPRMVELWEQGNDIAYGILRKRNDDFYLKTIGARIFYPLIYRMSPTPLPENATDFRIVSRRVIDVVKTMREPDRYLRGLIHWVGFKQASFEYDRELRRHGKTSVGFWHSIKWAINAMIAFSEVPLRIATVVGLLTMAGATLAAFFFIYIRLFPPSWAPAPPTGVTATIVLVLFGIGLNAFFLGIIGEYLGRVYNQGKARPLYVIDRTINIVPPALEHGPVVSK